MRKFLAVLLALTMAFVPLTPMIAQARQPDIVIITISPGGEMEHLLIERGTVLVRSTSGHNIGGTLDIETVYIMEYGHLILDPNVNIGTIIISEGAEGATVTIADGSTVGYIIVLADNVTIYNYGKIANLSSYGENTNIVNEGTIGEETITPGEPARTIPRRPQGTFSEGPGWVAPPEVPPIYWPQQPVQTPVPTPVPMQTLLIYGGPATANFVTYDERYILTLWPVGSIWPHGSPGSALMDYNSPFDFSDWEYVEFDILIGDVSAITSFDWRLSLISTQFIEDPPLGQSALYLFSHIFNAPGIQSGEWATVRIPLTDYHLMTPGFDMTNVTGIRIFIQDNPQFNTSVTVQDVRLARRVTDYGPITPPAVPPNTQLLIGGMVVNNLEPPHSAEMLVAQPHGGPVHPNAIPPATRYFDAANPVDTTGWGYLEFDFYIEHTGILPGYDWRIQIGSGPQYVENVPTLISFADQLVGMPSGTWQTIRIPLDGTANIVAGIDNVDWTAITGIRMANERGAGDNNSARVAIANVRLADPVGGPLPTPTPTPAPTPEPFVTPAPIPGHHLMIHAGTTVRNLVPFGTGDPYGHTLVNIWPSGAFTPGNPVPHFLSAGPPADLSGRTTLDFTQWDYLVFEIYVDEIADVPDGNSWRVRIVSGDNIDDHQVWFAFNDTMHHPEFPNNAWIPIHIPISTTPGGASGAFDPTAVSGMRIFVEGDDSWDYSAHIQVRNIRLAGYADPAYPPITAPAPPPPGPDVRMLVSGIVEHDVPMGSMDLLLVIPHYNDIRGGIPSNTVIPSATRGVIGALDPVDFTQWEYLVFDFYMEHRGIVPAYEHADWRVVLTSHATDLNQNAARLSYTSRIKRIDAGTTVNRIDSGTWRQVRIPLPLPSVSGPHAGFNVFYNNADLTAITGLGFAYHYDNSPHDATVAIANVRLEGAVPVTPPPSLMIYAGPVSSVYVGSGVNASPNARFLTLHPTGEIQGVDGPNMFFTPDSPGGANIGLGANSVDFSLWDNLTFDLRLGVGHTVPPGNGWRVRIASTDLYTNFAYYNFATAVLAGTDGEWTTINIPIANMSTAGAFDVTSVVGMRFYVYGLGNAVNYDFDADIDIRNIRLTGGPRLQLFTGVTGVASITPASEPHIARFWQPAGAIAPGPVGPHTRNFCELNPADFTQWDYIEFDIFVDNVAPTGVNLNALPVSWRLRLISGTPWYYQAGAQWSVEHFNSVITGPGWHTVTIPIAGFGSVGTTGTLDMTAITGLAFSVNYIGSRPVPEQFSADIQIRDIRLVNNPSGIVASGAMLSLDDMLLNFDIEACDCPEGYCDCLICDCPEDYCECATCDCPEYYCDCVVCDCPDYYEYCECVVEYPGYNEPDYPADPDYDTPEAVEPDYPADEPTTPEAVEPEATEPEDPPEEEDSPEEEQPPEDETPPADNEE